MKDKTNTPPADEGATDSFHAAASGRDRPEEAEAMTPEQLAEARRYGRRRLCCELAGTTLDGAYLAVMAFVFARPLDVWLQSFAALHRDGLRLGVFFFLLLALHHCLSLPLSFYEGFWLEHRYQLSRQSLVRWFSRLVLKSLLTAAFGLVLIEGLYWLIWLAGPYWVPAAAVGAFAVAAGLGQLAPVLILPLFYKIERLDDPSLAQRLGRLCEGTGLTIEGAYRMRLSSETVKANAMLAGLGRTRRVIVGDTLLERFTPDEVEVVFAHELGHHLHRHIPKLLLAALAYSGASFWLCDRVLAWRVASLEGAMRYAALPVHTLPLLLLTIAAFSLLLQPLKNALGRRFERQSDRYALQRTGMCEAFLSAFRKLAKLNKANPNPHPLETLLFHDHPPIAERLAMAEKFRKS